MTIASTTDSSSPTLSIKRRKRCVWTAAERAEWVALFERSGKRLNEFCREHDLSKTTLSLWRRQLREPAALQGDGRWVELAMAASQGGPEGRTDRLTMRLRGGVELEVVVGTDAVWLGQLLRELGACSG